MAGKRKEVTREELYTAVWAEPMKTAAKKYGVSSSFLSRVCRRIDVPHPTQSRVAGVVRGPSQL